MSWTLFAHPSRDNIDTLKSNVITILMESSNRLRRYSLYRNFPLFVLGEHIITIDSPLVLDKLSNIVRRHKKEIIAKYAV